MHTHSAAWYYYVLVVIGSTMGSETEDEFLRFKEFLNDFCEKHSGPVTSNHPLPFRLITFRLTKDEIEGECASWVIEYLQNQNNAPHLLVYLVVKEIVQSVLSADLSKFVEENHHDEDDEVEPCVEYNANGLARFVFSIVNEVCAKWRESLPVFTLPKRLPRYSLQAIRNSRRKMEDRHVVISDLHTLVGHRLQADQPYSFYGVYDGHGGVDASYYAAAHLHYISINDPQFTESPTRAMLDAFNQVDKAFIRKAKREGLRSGTTGVTAVITSDCIHLAWLGDSQAVLMRNGKAITIMEPHSPEREDEKRRIEDMGGCVVWFGAWRVNGSLSVSRSIGDPEYKPYVCSDADSAVIPLDGTEECVILACDGLWDGVTKEQACTVIQENIDSGADLSTVSSLLVNMAKDNGSGDNITALIVYLNPYHGQKTKLDDKESDRTVVKQTDSEPVENSRQEAATMGDSKETNSGTINTEGGATEVVDDLNSNNNNCKGANLSIFVENKIFYKGQNTGNTTTNSLKAKTAHLCNVNTSSHSSSSLGHSQERFQRSTNKPSEPPSQKAGDQKRSEVTEAHLPDFDIVSWKSNQKALPMKHNSMPITLKPKSTNSKSLNRNTKLPAILKTIDQRRTFPKGTRI